MRNPTRCFEDLMTRWFHWPRPAAEKYATGGFTGRRPDNWCPVCVGTGTIPTPGSRLEESCPGCGGSGALKPTTPASQPDLEKLIGQTIAQWHGQYQTTTCTLPQAIHEALKPYLKGAAGSRQSPPFRNPGPAEMAELRRQLGLAINQNPSPDELEAAGFPRPVRPKAPPAPPPRAPGKRVDVELTIRGYQPEAEPTPPGHEPKPPSSR